MRTKKTYEWMLLLVYVLLFGVFIYLNFVRNEEKLDISNIVVNGALFLIAAIIFFNVVINSFNPINRIIAELNRVAAKIRSDAMNSHEFLWDQYNESPHALFNEKVLNGQFSDYQYELNRISHSRNAYYKCDIEDYINTELTDTIIHRNILNQIPGVMTGLGILGTFIGLSLGLEKFSTGTTAEITNSIAPLMEGIKVAFHTSIYGMVFSLVFNYVLKRKVDDAESAVENFIINYKKYVLPDTTTDGINKLMELQESQTRAINSLAMTVAHQLSKGLTDLLMPQFDRFDKTISDFGMMQTRNQLDALSVVVEQFIKEMNKSLNNSFIAWSDTISKAYELQQANAGQIEMVLEKTGSSALKLDAIDKHAGNILDSFDAYTKDVTRIQDQINQAMEETGKVINLMTKNSVANDAFVEQERKYLDDLDKYRQSLEASSKTLNDQLTEQRDLLKDIKELNVKTPESVDETFKVIDKNLVSVETHFRDTIEQIQDVTDRTAHVVTDSTEYLEKAFNRASYAVERMADSLEQMKRDTGRGFDRDFRGDSHRDARRDSAQ
ncbi:MAG: MotA/TolQ/ExbB proton channel family protein [Lachnospiraceae bacterium]|nr:MotA/TolQ/ExbB proton channel family protein [Lachnospiraceae bacterium]